MILIHVMGGLGNQLYQYALYEKPWEKSETGYVCI